MRLMDLARMRFYRVFPSFRQAGLVWATVTAEQGWLARAPPKCGAALSMHLALEEAGERRQDRQSGLDAARRMTVTTPSRVTSTSGDATRTTTPSGLADLTKLLACE